MNADHFAAGSMSSIELSLTPTPSDATALSVAEYTIERPYSVTQPNPETLYRPLRSMLRSLEPSSASVCLPTRSRCWKNSSPRIPTCSTSTANGSSTTTARPLLPPSTPQSLPQRTTSSPPLFDDYSSARTIHSGNEDINTTPLSLPHCPVKRNC